MPQPNELPEDRNCRSDDKRTSSEETSQPCSGMGSLDADSLFKKGRRLLDSDKPTEAADCLGQAAQISPDNPAILKKLAAAYYQSEQHLPALRTYDRLIELGSATAGTWRATGDALTDVGEYAQAIGAYEHSIELDDKNAETHHNLARVVYRLGDVDRAVNHLQIATRHSDAIQSWLSLATLIPGAPQADHRRIREVRTRFADKLAQSLGPPKSRPTRSRTPHSGQRLRIGYVSSFFHSANYMKPVWALINHHDRNAFEIHLFSDSAAEQGMSGYAGHRQDRVHQTAELDNEELADLIAASGIDILVDLNAYSTAERLALFLQPIAPVTVAWFNMYATSGLPAFDYIVGDDEVVRPQEEPLFTETVLKLPVSYLTFEVTHPVPPVVAPPCVRNGFLTFGSLVSQYKITPPVLDAWSDILRRTDGTRLLLANSALKSVQNREYVANQLAQRGVDIERIALCGPADHLRFLEYYDQIDVALDAFPYNGGTTTMEAIWQGVPVLTFNGDRWASRTSQSVLRHTPFGQFVAKDPASLVDLAVEIARQPAAATLSKLRRHARQELKDCPPCDGPYLAKSMQRLYAGCFK